MANLELNNVRDNGAWIQLNVNGTGWNGVCIKASSHETTLITIVEKDGVVPSTFTSLDVRFHAKNNPSGSGQGDLRGGAEGGANGAIVVLGSSSGDPTYDACLSLMKDNTPVSTVFGYINAT